jgi:cytochrome c
LLLQLRADLLWRRKPLPASKCSSDCAPCHEIGPDAKIKLGPPLNGIDGRKSGTFDGFNYSPANKSSGITWSEETFPKYIRAPMQDMPGTRMAFVGIKNDKDIADLWAYLKQFGADGAKK